MRMRIVTSDEFGSIAAAVDEDGQIVATCSDGIRDGVYAAVDEAQVWALTGELLPAPLWDRCKD